MSDRVDFDFDVLIVGSGFGGSVSALRLTEKGYRVGVLEAGRRFSQEDFPRSNWDLRNYFWAPRLGMRGIQRMSLLKDVMILSGAGVGGGSLVYANTLYSPLEQFYSDPQWGHITDWKKELAPHYEIAKAMLGVNPVPFETGPDKQIRKLADQMGVSDTYGPTPVGVFFGKPGVTVKDPYFGGVGPDRTGCLQCGGCMIGCRHGAKNSLDQNYLYLAEKNGAKVFPDTQATEVVALPQGGYSVSTSRPGFASSKTKRTFTAEQVIFSAGVLGTLKLLMRMRDEGKLANLSDRIGQVVRTNSEAIVAASSKSIPSDDLTEGVAITSSMHPDNHTHIEPCRYPKGSNVMGINFTSLVDGGGKVPRQLRFLAGVIRHPRTFLRSFDARRWSERTIILLVMQAHDNSIRIRRKHGRLTTTPGHGEPNPTYLPVANEAARKVAENIDGDALSSWGEALLDVPTTAHIIGGCCIGDSPETGVIDPYHRVYGHAGLHVADGSAISANLGVNPSLTIAASTERAMSFWPNKGESDPRPTVGAQYVALDAVLPKQPAVGNATPVAIRAAAADPVAQGAPAS